MCNGPLLGSILRFAIPLMLSGILQLLFNAADIIVVGQFTGSGAMAAVGSTSSLNNLIINLFLGLSAGGSVVMALFYGAKDWKSVEEVAHTAILRADAKKQAAILEAEGQAEAILKVQEATAESIRRLNAAMPSEPVIKLRALEAFTAAADGKATKIIIPSEIQSLAGLAASFKELIADDAPAEPEKKK